MIGGVKVGTRQVLFRSIEGVQFFNRQEFLALRHDQPDGSAVVTITNTIPADEQMALAAEQALAIEAEQSGHPILDECGLDYTLQTSPIPGIPHLRKRVR